MKYLLVSVYRHDMGDCSMNGVTSPKRDLKLFVPHERGNYNEEELESRDDVAMLELGSIRGSEFFKPRGENRHTMNGGNFVYSCDSRFVEKYGDRPIRVHDRIEG